MICSIFETAVLAAPTTGPNPLTTHCRAMQETEIVDIMKEQGWDGYLLSEYEGRDKYDLGYEVGQTLRRHHIMLKRYLGD